MAELTPEQISEIITAAVCKSVSNQVPTPPRKKEPNWQGTVSLILAIVVAVGGVIGVWINSSNKTASMDVRLATVEGTVLKNGSRIDGLEATRLSSQTSAAQLTDLKEAFDKFQLQNREDWNDMKAQVRDLQDKVRTGKQ